MVTNRMTDAAMVFCILSLLQHNYRRLWALVTAIQDCFPITSCLKIMAASNLAQVLERAAKWKGTAQA